MKLILRSLALWFAAAFAIGAGLALGFPAGAALLRGACVVIYGRFQ